MSVRITSIVGDSYHFETAKKMLLDQISMPSAPTEMTIPIQLLKNTEFFRQLGLGCFHKATDGNYLYPHLHTLLPALFETCSQQQTDGDKVSAEEMSRLTLSSVKTDDDVDKFVLLTRALFQSTPDTTVSPEVLTCLIKHPQALHLITGFLEKPFSPPVQKKHAKTLINILENFPGNRLDDRVSDNTINLIRVLVAAGLTVSDLTSERELPFYKAIRHEIEHPIGESREIEARDREITRLREELAAAASTSRPHPTTTDSRFF